MPVINLPSHMDPKRASVMNSPMERAMRKLGSVLGGTPGPADLADLSGSFGLPGASASLLPLLMKVPREAAETLVPRLLSNWPNAPDKVVAAVQALAARFPRMMSHVESISEPDLMFKLTGGGTAKYIPVEAEAGKRLGRIHYNPGYTSPVEQLTAEEAITHELTHAAQNLRAGTIDQFKARYGTPIGFEPDSLAEQGARFSQKYQTKLMQGAQRTPDVRATAQAEADALRNKIVRRNVVGERREAMKQIDKLEKSGKWTPGKAATKRNEIQAMTDEEFYQMMRQQTLDAQGRR